MMRRGADRARLRLLQRLAVVPFLILALRLVQVQVYQHDHYLALALKQWQNQKVLPAARGNIYDRNGRSLALSIITWRVGAVGKNLQDQDPDALAAKLSPLIGQDVGSLADRLRQAKAKREYIPLDRKAVLHETTQAALRRLPGIELEELHSRSYPMGGAGASLLGFCNPDSGSRNLTAGLERSLDDDLAGQPGKGLMYAMGPGENTDGLQVTEPAVDGHDVMLTIDADLQLIAEQELAAAVDSCRAVGGTVLIVDPHTGDILAAADTPVLRERSDAKGPSAWDNFVFTGAYEPGSVFKIFTAASLLDRSQLDTAAVYDCDNIQFDRYKIHNSEGHDFGRMSFLNAFVHSSNVYFARTVLALDREQYFDDLTNLGFGVRDEVLYPGRTRGSLQAPDKWSRRTQSTVAIGQELLATPIQLAMAAAAVANGGMLMAPRLVVEIREKDGSVVERTRPEARHRAVSAEVAALLRDALGEVVRRGTGRAAGLEWIECGGKTGTAQKALPGEGYVPGKYMSTFLGMVPAAAPRLVILTMLDEPDYAHHYASQSAAPLFGRIVQEIGRSTDWLVGAETAAHVRLPRRDRSGAQPVPDLLYLSAAAAREAVAGAGLHLAGAVGEGVVVAQVPGAGTGCLPGETVTITLAPLRIATGADSRLCPDLLGWSNRDVRREAARLGVPLRCEGTGYVAEQTPPPGLPIGAEGIAVRMVERW